MSRNAASRHESIRQVGLHSTALEGHTPQRMLHTGFRAEEVCHRQRSARRSDGARHQAVVGLRWSSEWRGRKRGEFRRPRSERRRRELGKLLP